MSKNFHHALNFRTDAEPSILHRFDNYFDVDQTRGRLREMVKMMRDYIKDDIYTRNITLATATGRVHALKTFVTWLEETEGLNISTQNLDSTLLNEYSAWLRYSKRSIATVYTLLSALRGYLSWSERNGLSRSGLKEGLRLPHRPLRLYKNRKVDTFRTDSRPFDVTTHPNFHSLAQPQDVLPYTDIDDSEDPSLPSNT